MNKIRIVNDINVEDFLLIRESVNWNKNMSLEQVKRAVSNSMFNISVFINDK